MSRRGRAPLRVLMVIAHPCPDSFTHAVAAAARRGLESAGHQVDALDLHGIGFRAAMSLEERRAYDSANPLLDPIAHDHADLVRSTDAIVFVYPTWWSGLPAILKGWLERVLVPGTAFRFDDRGRVRPALGHLRHIVGFSTYGSPRWYVRLVNDNGRRTLTRALRLTCGPRTSTTWRALYGVDTSTAVQRERFLAEVETATRRLR